MGQEPGDRDLRESTSHQPGAYQPWLELRREGDQIPPEIPSGGWDALDYTEIVEEHGLVGYRIVAKIIDYFVWSTSASILLVPVYFIWFFANVSTIEELSLKSESDVFPTGSFVSFFIIWCLMFLVMLLTSVSEVAPEN